jgi:LL-diaminopimelate aminotransferase
MAVRDFYERRFDVTLDPAGEIIPAIGAKEAIFNLNLAFLDPGDYALAADPGYPVYTGGPWLAGAEPVLMALEPELGFIPDFGQIDDDVARRAKLMYLNYPNNPTGALAPDGFFERVVEFARAYDILVVHDNAYSEIAFDGYKPPSFLQTPGAKDVGIEVFSLSKGYNMTGWRCAVLVGNAEALQTYWRLKTNIDSGLFDAVQLAGVAALSPEADAEVASIVELYRKRRDLVCDALREIGVDVRPPHATIYVWAPIPDGYADSAAYAEYVLEQAGVVITPGAVYGPAGEGWFRISLTTPDDRLLEAVQRLGALAA